MSSTNALVYEITKFTKHPNADSLYLAEVGGWQCVTNKFYNVGNRVIFIEPGSVLTQEFADLIEVTPYLKKKVNQDGNKVLVVGQTRLRGEPSFGIILPTDREVGEDLAEEYGIIKFEPPVKQFNIQQNTRPDHPIVKKYTDIENLRKWPNIFEPDEEVICVSKIHGTNSRIGYIISEETGEIEWLAGSRRLMREKPENFDPNEIIADTYQNELYWLPYSVPGVMSLLNIFAVTGYKTVTLYGEIYGGNIQPFNYGLAQPKYCAFDICVEGEFYSYDHLINLLDFYNIPHPPVMYRGPYSLEAVRQAAEMDNTFGGNHIQEGVVVRPVVERYHPKVGRLIMKYVQDAYLLNKEIEKSDTTDM